MPLSPNGEGYSDHTAWKSRRTDEIIMEHLIRHKSQYPEEKYYWFDFTCGNGESNMVGHAPSPIVFLKCVKSAGIDFTARFVDEHKNDVLSLRSILSKEFPTFVESKHVDYYGLEYEDFCYGYEDFCGDSRNKKYGMIYCDPNGVFSVDSLNSLQRVFTREIELDIMLHISYRSTNRVRMALKEGGNYISLFDSLPMLNKKHFYISESDYGFCLILGTNSEYDFDKVGIKDVKSRTGKKRLNDSSQTKGEKHKRERGVQLWA